MFRHLKSNAARHAADAARLQRDRNAHAKQGYAILERRLGSPPGLIMCFGAGVFAGASSRRRDLCADDQELRSGRRPEHAEPGFTERLLHGPLGAAAIRFGTAFLAGALLHPEHAESDGTDPDILL